MTRLVVATAGTSFRGLQSPQWKALVETVCVDGAWPWQVLLKDGVDVAQHQHDLRMALKPKGGIPAADAVKTVTAEVGGLFAAGGPLADARTSDDAWLRVEPVPSEPRVVLIASDTREGVKAAVVVALLLADRIELTHVGVPLADRIELARIDEPDPGSPPFPDRQPRAAALVGTATVLIVKGLNGARPPEMAAEGLPNLGLALMSALDHAAQEALETVDVALSGGFKSAVAHVPQAVGLIGAARRRNNPPWPEVRMSTLFEPWEGRYRAIEYPSVDVDLLPTDWTSLRRLQRGAQEAADPPTTRRLSPLLLSKEGQLTPFGAALTEHRFPERNHHPLIDELNGHHGAHLDRQVVIDAVSGALDDLERDEEDGELRRLMDAIESPFREQLVDCRSPGPVWPLGADQLVSQAEAREGIRSLRLVPVNELGYQLVIARLKAAGADDASRQAPLTQASAALNRWVVLLRRRPGEIAARRYPKLDAHADGIIDEINGLAGSDAAERNHMLDAVIRGALLPQFRLARSFQAVEQSLKGRSSGRAAYWLAGGLAFAGPALTLLALTILDAGGYSPTGMAALSATASLAIAIGVVAAVGRSAGIATAHPFAPRLLGSCLIGTIALVGLGDLLEPLLRTVKDGGGRAMLLTGGVLLVALAATTLYLLVELSANATPTKLARPKRLEGALTVAWLGLQYSLAGACVVAPIRTAAVANDRVGALAAFDKPLAFAPIVVVASLALVIGVLSQLFWQDKTAVDPL